LPVLPTLPALLNGTSPRAEQSSVLLPASLDYGLASAFIYDLTDRFQATSQFLAKHIWINSQLRCSEAVSKCVTKIQIFYMLYLLRTLILKFYQKSNRVFLASFSLHKPLCVFLMVILSHSEKLNPAAVCITLVFP